KSRNPVALLTVLPRDPSTPLRSLRRTTLQSDSLRAGSDNCLRSVYVADAPLEFGLQFDGKLRKIDEIPSRELPNRLRRSPSTFIRCSFARRTCRAGAVRRLVFKSNDEMHCIVAHFVRRLLRFEIKSAETAIAVSGGIKLRV